MENINLEDIINALEGFLTFTGTISLFWFIVKIFIPEKIFMNNVYIDRVSSDLKDYVNFYDFPSVEQNFSEITKFEAIGEKINTVEVISINYLNEDCTNYSEKTIKKYKNVMPHRPIYFPFYYSCGAPLYKLRWEGKYGIKGEWVFTEDGRNGVERLSDEYKLTAINKIRKILDV